MKAFWTIATLLALAVAVFAQGEDSSSSKLIHKLQKRQIYKPVTIMVKPPFPGCVFYECIPSCKRSGHSRGGICTINGCQCLH